MHVDVAIISDNFTCRKKKLLCSQHLALCCLHMSAKFLKTTACLISKTSNILGKLWYLGLLTHWKQTTILPKTLWHLILFPKKQVPLHPLLFPIEVRKQHRELSFWADPVTNVRERSQRLGGAFNFPSDQSDLRDRTAVEQTPLCTGYHGRVAFIGS